MRKNPEVNKGAKEQTWIAPYDQEHFNNFAKKLRKTIQKMLATLGADEYKREVHEAARTLAGEVNVMLEAVKISEPQKNEVSAYEKQLRFALQRIHEFRSQIGTQHETNNDEIKDLFFPILEEEEKRIREALLSFLRVQVNLLGDIQDTDPRIIHLEKRINALRKESARLKIPEDQRIKLSAEEEARKEKESRRQEEEKRIAEEKAEEAKRLAEIAQKKEEERARIVKNPPPIKVPHAKNPLLSDRIRKRIVLAGAAIAGLFGIKLGVEKTVEEIKGITNAVVDVVTASTHTRVNEGMAKGTYMVDAPQPKDTLTSKQELNVHTVTSGDTLWGIATDMITNLNVSDPHGAIALQAVRALRDENDIQGNPATSKKMWVGETLHTKKAEELIKKHLPAEERAVQAASSTKNSEQILQNKHTISSTDASLGANEHAAETTSAIQSIPEELLAAHLNAPGETIWSRTYDILESVGIERPNISKRAVLGAIILADSHLSETQAMRIKYVGHKKFDPAKDTLNFSRAAAVAADLKAGMSPATVAKKYGVANVYERIRNR